MITASGKRLIKRYLAGQAGEFVGALSIGIDDTAATLNDTRMGFESSRIPVDIIAFDFVEDKLIFKGSLPEDASGKIYEVGIWSTDTNPSSANQASRIITSFDSETEDWSPATFDTVTVRIGSDSLKHTPTASTTSTSTMGNLTLDFQDHSAADEFVFAFNVDNANTASIAFRFMTDAANYYEFVVATPTAGYKVVPMAKGSASVVGSPSWDEIYQIEVATTATAGGSASVEFDGIRIEDVDSVNPEYGLIARFVPAAPVVKAAGSVQDFEYTLVVTV